MTRWTQADQHRPARQTTAVENTTTAARTLTNLTPAHGTRIHRALDLMRLLTDTGIQAARARDGGVVLWCDDHSRPHTICVKDRLTCNGTPYEPGADPVGELAGSRDQAASDQAEAIRILERIAADTTRLAELVTDYTRKLTTCAHCRTPITEVDLRSDGRPRHPGYCRRCGDFRSLHQQLPPPPILRAWATGTTVTKAMIDAALGPRRPRRHPRTARSTP